MDYATVNKARSVVPPLVRASRKPISLLYVIVPCSTGVGARDGLAAPDVGCPDRPAYEPPLFSPLITVGDKLDPVVAVSCITS